MFPVCPTRYCAWSFGAQQAAAELVARLAAVPDIAADIESAVRVSDRRWDLVLASGTRVRLPEGDVSRALAQLTDMRREYEILNQDVVSIDLRLSDRLVVRLPSDEALDDDTAGETADETDDEPSTVTPAATPTATLADGGGDKT